MDPIRTQPTLAARLWRWACRSRSDERGVGMVMAILITAIIFSLTALWNGMADHQVQRSTHERNSEQATHAAEAGLHKAMSLIAADPARTDSGQPAGSFTITDGDLDQHGDQFGKFTVTVTAPNGVTDPLRQITSEAWTPRTTSTDVKDQAVGKKVVAGVNVSFTTGLDYALFSTESVDASERLVVNGDIYADNQAVWEHGSSITGDVISWGGIASRGTVTGTLKSAGALSTSPPLVASTACTASAGNSCGVWVRSGAVQGDVFAPANGALDAGRVAVAGHNQAGEPSPSVTGHVWAETEIVGTGATGSETVGVAPPLPIAEGMPSFDPSVYTWSDHSSPDAFDTWFDDRNQALTPPHVEGNRRIISGSGTVELGGTYCALLCPDGDDSTWTEWKMTGDTIIYTDEKVRLSADIVNASSSGEELNLVVVTTYNSTSSTDHAVEFVGNVTPPDSVEVLVFAPDGSVAADATQQTFSGVVYAEGIQLSDNFDIEHEGFGEVLGFSFPLPSHVPVEIVSYEDQAL